MQWHVSSVGGDDPSALYGDGGEAVDDLVARVRRALLTKKGAGGTWRDVGLFYEADLWFAATTVDLLKRWVDGVDGVSGDLGSATVLHIKIQDIEVIMHRVYTIEEVAREFLGEGE